MSSKYTDANYWAAVTKFYEIMSQKLMSKKITALGAERSRPPHIPYVYELRVKNEEATPTAGETKDPE